MLSLRASLRGAVRVCARPTARPPRPRPPMRASSSGAGAGAAAVAEIERKWQARWRDEAAAAAAAGGEPATPDHYVLAMFPYPSGNLHMGHVRVYAISDALARFERMRGRRVLHPLGWDAFGLPAENAAIDRGEQPRAWTLRNIAHMKQQLQALGLAVDWGRELATCHPGYYRWTQQLFVDLLEAGLAYRKTAEVNWDPVDQTVLADEQVDAEGRSWRSGARVQRRELPQWFFRVTAFADELDRGLDALPRWPEQVRRMQRNWIGRSEGARLHLAVPGAAAPLAVFTTRLDTLFGATFVAVAPGHPALAAWRAHGLLSPADDAAVAQLRASQAATRLALAAQEGADAAAAEAPVAGVRLSGVSALHPLLGTRLPVFVASYVSADYATGAAMGVPAHNSRDAALAALFALPAPRVVAPDAAAAAPKDAAAGQVFAGDGVLQASGAFSGMASAAARDALLAALASRGVCERATYFRLRDWLVSRQRFWGAPVPVVHCGACGPVAVPSSQLPVTLPPLTLAGRGGVALASEAARTWRETRCPRCGGAATRDTDTCDTFVDSSWYFLRYLSPRDEQRMFDVAAARALIPVHTYVGGVEHAILHLLYARFVTRFLHARGLLRSPEPFEELVTQGMVHGETFRLASGAFVPRAQVRWETGQDGARAAVHAASGAALSVTWEKMSKSKLNGVEPDALVARFGADTVRLFALFKAPVDRVLDWEERGVVGQSRWLARLADLAAAAGARRTQPQPQQRGALDAEAEAALRRATAAAVRAVTRAYEQRAFNVGVAELMKLSNALADAGALATGSAAFADALRTLLRLLAPMAPHWSSELWERVCGAAAGDVHAQPWPSLAEAEEEAAAAAAAAASAGAGAGAGRVALVVQVDGKVRAKLEADAAALAGGGGGGSSDDEAAERMARAQPAVARHIAGRKVQRVVVARRARSVLVSFVCE